MPVYLGRSKVSDVSFKLPNDIANSVRAQSKSVTPATTPQTVLPDEGFNYLSQVMVAAIPYVESDNAAGGKTVTIG